MNNHIKPQDFTGKILSISVLLGPIAMLFLIILGSVFEEWHGLSLSDMLGMFLFGSIICIVISIFASLIIYRFLISMAVKKTGLAMEHFTRFLPVLVALFPVGGSLLMVLADLSEPLFYSIVISAYLTSVLGWFWLSVDLAKKQKSLNFN